LIAAFDAIKTLLGAVYAYTGRLHRRPFGHRAAFIGFTGASIVGYLMVVLLPPPVASCRDVPLSRLERFLVARDVLLSRIVAAFRQARHGIGSSP